MFCVRKESPLLNKILIIYTVFLKNAWRNLRGKCTHNDELKAHYFQCYNMLKALYPRL